ncbi:MAG TPA: hypothetical protein VFR70_07360 [Flavobacterium sp.]|nr:hypothetical protein [Flavobacterium sp.]
MKTFIFAAIALLFANTITAQQTGAKTKSEVEQKKADAAEASKKAEAKADDAQKKATDDVDKAKSKAAAPKTETAEEKVSGEYFNGKKVYTGPKGGKYYINSQGNKTYIGQ